MKEILIDRKIRKDRDKEADTTITEVKIAIMIGHDLIKEIEDSIKATTEIKEDSIVINAMTNGKKEATKIDLSLTVLPKVMKVICPMIHKRWISSTK